MEYVEKLNYLTLNDGLFETFLGDIDNILEKEWQGHVDSLSSNFEILAKARLSKNAVAEMIAKIPEWKEKFTRQPIFICMLVKILNKYALIEPRAFELLLLYAKDLLTSPHNIANMFSVQCLKAS